MRTVVFLLVTINILWAQQEPAQLQVTLKDGSVIIGRFVSETSEVLILESKYSGQITIPLSDILERKEVIAGRAGWTSDRNYSRYLWSPTAFALKAQHGYCASACLFLPSFAWGITDKFSVLGGITLIPSLKLTDQLMQIAAKYTLFEQDGMAMSAGVQYFGLSVDDQIDFGFGFAFATVTRGDHNTHISGSIGYGFARASNSDEGISEFEWMDRPILTLSGIRRVSKNISLITENWLLPEIDLADTPLSMGIRFIGDRLSVNVAGLFTLSMFEEGIMTPFPWVDFSFHMGQ